MGSAQTRKRLFAQRPELIRRYIRTSVIRKGRDIGRALGRMRARRALLRAQKEQIRALVRALEGCAREALRAKRNKLKASEAVFNLALYFLVAERDIQMVKVDALTHPDPWRRSLFARVILLTIHELEIDKAGGSKLRVALEDAAVPAELRQEMTKALRAIRAAQAKAQKQFAVLRHTTIAHRDADAISQYQKIIKLDSLEIMQTASEFYKGTDAFMSVIPRLISHVGGMNGVIAQLVAQHDRLQKAN